MTNEQAMKLRPGAVIRWHDRNGVLWEGYVARGGPRRYPSGQVVPVDDGGPIMTQAVQVAAEHLGDPTADTQR